MEQKEHTLHIDDEKPEKPMDTVGRYQGTKIVEGGGGPENPPRTTPGGTHSHHVAPHGTQGWRKRYNNKGETNKRNTRKKGRRKNRQPQDRRESKRRPTKGNKQPLKTVLGHSPNTSDQKRTQAKGANLRPHIQPIATHPNRT